MTNKMTVQDGQVVAMEYTLLVDGEMLDTSVGREPLEFLAGTGSIIPGLEREMIGMAVGESKDVVVSPADGYGEIDEDAYMDVPRDRFPEGMPIEPGVELQVSDGTGNPMYARIDSVEGDLVRLNFNHPLAGKELHFNVKVVGLRPATPEELEHGHVHAGGHHH
jgi:FKBP-type peptidyl-prolyl cis-trans isomerase SlyD